MDSPKPRRDRRLLLAWLVVTFALSAVTDLRALVALWALAPLLLWRHAWEVAKRVLMLVWAPVAFLVLASFAWLRVVQGAWPDPAPYAAMALRTLLIAFVTFSVLRRVELLRAVSAWPVLARLLVITLAQIHALRLLASESLLGLRSRMPRKPGAVDVVRGASGVTGALFTLASRNAREVTDAMRSRGF